MVSLAISGANLFYFISFEVLKIRCFDAKKIALFLILTKNLSRFLSPSEYTPIKKDLSPDISPGPIFVILRYFNVFHN